MDDEQRSAHRRFTAWSTPELAGFVADLEGDSDPDNPFRTLTEARAVLAERRTAAGASPSDVEALDDRLHGLHDRLTHLRRAVAELGDTYGQCDPGGVRVEGAGEPISAEHALSAALDALNHVGRALLAADEAAEAAERYTARLRPDASG